MIHLIAHHAEHISRRLLVLLVVAVLALPLIGAAERLRLNVDGAILSVLSYDATVADVLQAQGVELAAGDRVLPAPTTPLAAVEAITVLRTINVSLDLDGVVSEHRGTWRTVEGLLSDIGVAVEPTQVLRPSARTRLANGDVVTVRSPKTVVIVADGEVAEVDTHLDNVGELLASAGVTVNEVDLVTPTRVASLATGTEIVVQRVSFDDVVDEVAIPFEEETRDTDELFIGQTRTAQVGVNGVREDTYRVTFVDGEGSRRELLSSVVVKEPVTRIVEEGTVERPSQAYIDDGSVWYDLARCESGLRWDYNGGSGFDGGLQFHPNTWSRNKLSGYPKYAWQATPQQQIEVGKVVQRRQGWRAWPSCARKLGLL